jgi:serine/threonine protein kinase/cytochrome c-type biogenesis protein CcmH/NrfG
MELSIPQIALMSRLLDEALPLDTAGRRRWLENLSPEYQDLVPALRKALLPGESQAAATPALKTLPKLGSAAKASVMAASGLQPGAHVGPYELIRLLGAGGMAEVWLARRADGAFKREVALKLPNLSGPRANLERRFARERDILASLEHPHIARFYDAGIDPNGLPYFAMEYVQGQQLTDWCDAHQLKISARLTLLEQVLEAVQYAHEKHVIHRDLKPANILVAESGQVRLLDFGVAKLLEAEEEDQTRLTGVYGRALTLDYASPELLRGDPIDQRSDVYSLGVVFYELLTGVRPYRLKSAASIGLLEQAIATVEVKKPSTQIEQEAVAARATTRESLARQLRGDLDAIALKALAKDPAERYPSADTLAEDLQRYLQGKPIKAQPARISYQLRKFVERNKAMVGASAMVVAAILATVGYTLYRETVTPIRTAAPGLPVTAFSPPAHSVAVLPFVDLSEKKDQEYFGDGMAEEVIDLLAQVPDLNVAARTSSFSFKGRAEDISTIAQKLRVAQVLEGSVRRAGDTLRVTAQLIRADNGYHLWSKSYDRDVKDVFKVQHEIASAVVEALKAKLLPAQQIINRHRTNSTEAYTQYLLGSQLRLRDSPESNRQALAAYRKAISLDPDYAAAWSGVASAEWRIADSLTNEPAAYTRAATAADKAIALAPESPEGYWARGGLRNFYFFDWAGAAADYARALELDPNFVPAAVDAAQLKATLGHLSQAIEALDQAVQRDPLSVYARRALATLLFDQGDFAKAREATQRLLEISDDSWAHALAANIWLVEGEPDKAFVIYRTIAGARPQKARIGTAMAEHSLGHAVESQHALDQVIRELGNTLAYQVAEVYAWRAETDRAFEWLERAYRQHDGGLIQVKHDRFLERLRRDPRFDVLLRKLKLPE